jgi:protease-4
MADPIIEQGVLAQLAREWIQERRRARRWGIFFRLLIVVLLLPLFVLLWGAISARERVCLDKCTALVEVRGELEAGGRASADRVIQGLQAAYKNGGTRGVVLRVNSPGGSPVQAGQIYEEVRRLRAANPDKPLYAVVDEVAASGGYYVAAAAERIYVDKASLVGSIGVIMEGFGFVGAMDKLGIERRVLTAGANKALLDPFSPVDAAQREAIQQNLDEVHQQFIAAVKAGRGDRLKATPEVFSGLVWNGRRAVELGLADALGTLESVARDVIKADEIVDFTPEEGFTERVARRFGATLADALVYTVRMRESVGRW